MNVVSRIREQMKNKNIKQKDLIEHLQVNQGTLAKWLSLKEDNRRDIPNTILVKIADFLKTDVHYLLGFANEEKLSVKYIPLIGLASCGVPREYALDGYEPVPVSIDIYRDGMYAVKAEGNSMSPKINHNNLVYCLPNETIDNGHIVHYTLNGESGIKKYKLNEKGDIISLVPINPDYDVITIHADEPHSLKMARVLGVVDTEF